MTLEKECVNLPKYIVYDMYDAITYDSLEYDAITRSRMIKKIIAQYKCKDYLYHICTERELKFLKYFLNNKLDKKAFIKYGWEIGELSKKGIFSVSAIDIYEEQLDNVRDAIKKYESSNDKKNEDDIITFMVSVLKINGTMLTKVLNGMISSIFNLSEDAVDHMMGHPLFHFYCDFYKEEFYFSDVPQEIVYYREYYDYIDDIAEGRKLFGMAGKLEQNSQDNYDFFYYGFPIRISKVKKMYDMIMKKNQYYSLFPIINTARLLNDSIMLDTIIDDSELLEVIYDALDEMPSAVMNGFSPNQYEKELEKEMELDKQFTLVEQEDAHLSNKDADLFYKLYFALLEYVNNKKNISKIKEIYKQENMNANDLIPIDKYLWENKYLIDEFIRDNLYGFTKEELDIIDGFKSNITRVNFIVVGFDNEYTHIFDYDTGKVYMVKGIRVNMDTIVESKKIPFVINTTLLKFKEFIIFNSFFVTNDIIFGNDFRSAVLNESKNAMKCYHL